MRNLHGKAFGGFVASTAYDLAYFAARYFVRGSPFAPVGLHEATFLQPVAIGDMVRLVRPAPSPAFSRLLSPSPTSSHLLSPSPAFAQVRFVARVTHSANDGLFTVLVTMDVIEPSDHGRWPKRSNRLCFGFATDPQRRRVVLPSTYSEVLMHVAAARRHAVQGLPLRAKEDIERFCKKRQFVAYDATDLYSRRKMFDKSNH